ANWTADNALSVYGMSERLFVIDQDDATAPSFVSFADDVAGGTVNVADNPSITYTLTFDEAMLPGTVDAGDFGNGGTAGFTVDSIVQQEDPAVFEVAVSPTSEGDLTLQINQGAEMTDLNGNLLDTSTGIIDGTTIAVEDVATFDSWSGGLPADEDANNDGVANAVAWVLGANDPDANALGLLPTLDSDSDPEYALFNFSRLDEANDDPDTSIVVEYSADLGGSWTTAVDDGDNVIIEVTDGSPSDTVVVQLKRATLATDDKLFVRLSVTVGGTAP
ncbi:MAG: Ig-like domain-containing protein, partial [Opitutales bacterium]